MNKQEIVRMKQTQVIHYMQNSNQCENERKRKRNLKKNKHKRIKER